MTIQDDGRGIPVDKHPKTKTSALEVIFTKLHAGGKFEGQNYKTAGGLHGVGASVVNALSRELVATVRRDGSTWEQKYRQGDPVGGVKKLGPARGTGTTIFFRPDSTIFPKTQFDASIIRERLEVSSYLHRGLKVVFENEAAQDGEPRREVFQHDQGIVEYLGRILAERKAKPVHDAIFAVAREHDETGLKLDLVLQWTESTDEHVRSYVNGIPTGSGGTHENGLRAGLGKAIRNFIDTHSLSPKGVTLTAEDIREGMHRRVERVPQRAAVPGADERPAQQPGSDGDRRLDGPAGAGALAEPQQDDRRVDRRAHHPRGPRARSQPRGAGGGHAQERDVVAPHAAGQAQRLHVARPRGERDLHRRGRLGRRIRQAGTRPRAAGDSAAPRQGAERRERVAREGAREQGTGGSGHGARLRHRQRLRDLAPPLRPRHHPGGRRFGRPPHRDAAPDVHLPAHPAADSRRARSSSRSRRSTASTSAKRRIGRSTTATRTTSSSASAAAASRRSRGSKGSAR